MHENLQKWHLIFQADAKQCWLTSSDEMISVCVVICCLCYSRSRTGCVHMSGSEWAKREKEQFFTHTFGVLLGLHPLLCSHAVASAGQPSSECVSHSIRCWEAVRLSALVPDILHLPWEAGQPCHSNVKHMWNRPGQTRPTHTHTHTHIHTGRRTEQEAARTTLCMRINSSETIEMQRRESHFITLRVAHLL